MAGFSWSDLGSNTWGAAVIKYDEDSFLLPETEMTDKIGHRNFGCLLKEAKDTTPTPMGLKR